MLDNIWISHCHLDMRLYILFRFWISLYCDMASVLSFPGVKGCITAEWCNLVNSSNCSACSDTCLHPLSHYIHNADEYLSKIMLSWYFVSVPSVTWSLYFWSAFDGISNYRDVYRVLNSALRPYCPVMGVYNDTGELPESNIADEKYSTSLSLCFSPS